MQSKVISVMLNDSLGHSRMDAAADPAGVQAEVGDRLHTVVPAPEGSWDTVQEHFGRDLKK